MTLFPWAYFSPTQHALKLHTLLDLRGQIPTFIRITSARVHDVNMLDQLTPEPGAFYIMDRGYLNFERLYRWTFHGAFFVTRARKNFRFLRLVSHPVDKSTDVHHNPANYEYLLVRENPDKSSLFLERISFQLERSR